MAKNFELQGHRGARGLKPENTLPGFEIALDLEVSAIETDLHLTRDGIPVIFHDVQITGRVCQATASALAIAECPMVSSLKLSQLRYYRADRNPEYARFSDQNADVTPLAKLFADRHGIDPYTPPSLIDLYNFIEAYAGKMGAAAGKGTSQQARALEVQLDLELKRIPFTPQTIGDGYDGTTAERFETAVIKVIRAAGMVNRTTLRSFDHRSIKYIRTLEPGLIGAVLVCGMAPIDPAGIAVQAGAQIYCPEFEFLDHLQIRQLHDAGIRVIPWTVNNSEDWDRLLDWGVDGITTDYPNRLADLLRRRGVTF